MRAAESRDAAVATGFAAAVLARLSVDDDRPILWVVEAAAAREAGSLYGAGLARFGLDPARSSWSASIARRMPSGFSRRGSAAAASPPSPPRSAASPACSASPKAAGWRCRAAEHGVMGLLVRQSSHPGPGAATTRWLVAPQPAAASADHPAAIGHPAWRLTLERNRRGATGVFDVEWNHDQRRFASLPALAATAAHPRPVAALSRDRPASTARRWENRGAAHPIRSRPTLTKRRKAPPPPGS
ncbi:MAG: hypothetical protein WDM84_00080 [Bauldia sp.]